MDRTEEADVSTIELPLVPQPYPGMKPWVDLGGYVVNGWAAGAGNFVLWGSVDGNLARLYLRTRRGTDRTITDSLPPEFRPPGQRVFNAFSARGERVGILLESSGQIQIYAPGQSYADLIDGTLSNLVVDASYLRRPA